MAHSLIVDDEVRRSEGRRALDEILDRRAMWGAGYDPEKAKIRRNQKQMARFERQTGASPDRVGPPVRGRRTGKPPPPGARR